MRMAIFGGRDVGVEGGTQPDDSMHTRWSYKDIVCLLAKLVSCNLIRGTFCIP